MGPATAILIIPNLKWSDINKSSSLFQSVSSTSRPLNASIAPSCTEAYLIEENIHAPGNHMEQQQP